MRVPSFFDESSSPPLSSSHFHSISKRSPSRTIGFLFDERHSFFFFFFKQIRLLLLSRIIGFFEKDSQRTEISFATRLLVPFLRRRETSPPLSEERPRNEARFKFNLTLSRVKRHDNEPLTTDYNNNHGGGKSGGGGCVRGISRTEL